jgi:hypothetical protein
MNPNVEWEGNAFLNNVYLRYFLPIVTFIDIRSQKAESYCKNEAVHLKTFMVDSRPCIEVSDPVAQPTAMLHQGDSFWIDFEASLYFCAKPSSFGRSEFLILTDQDHRGGYITTSYGHAYHECLGATRQTIDVPKNWEVIEAFVSTGETPQFDGVRLSIVQTLRSMTARQIIYGTLSRHERRSGVEKLAKLHGINLRDLAKQAGLEYVLDLPDAMPLSKREHEAREKAVQQRTAEMPKLPTSTFDPSLISAEVDHCRTVYQTEENGDENLAMLAAFEAAQQKAQRRAKQR